jgi:UDP-N-acetylmuramate--alanine ligase
LLLIDAGIDPTVHLGAELKQFRSTVHLGRPGGLMVSEACEYMRSFLKFRSSTAAVLNIDYDHVDCFANLQDVIDTFTEFSDQLPPDGQLVVPAFDPSIGIMIQQLTERRQNRGETMPAIWTFGLSNDSFEGRKPTVYAADLVYDQGLPRFDVYIQETFYAHIELAIPGRHNVANALAAIACGHLNGSTPESAARVLASFDGAEGRFTYTGTYRGALVVADYAHHPAAARATLDAASNIPHQHLWVVFQPLTYSRTRVLFDDYVSALKDCELVIFSEIFSDREVNKGDISSRMLSDRINELGGHAVFEESFDGIRRQLDEVVEPGDLILVLGPEDIRSLADQLTGRKDIWS